MDTFVEADIRNSVGIIPARLESTRLPRKLLLDLEGKPVLQWTIEGASSSRYLRRILVATDSQEIADFCVSIGVDFVLTPNTFTSGTERVFWVYKNLGEKFDYVVNIQGDEPFIKGSTIDALLRETFRHNANISTIIARINNQDELFASSTVKVVVGLDNFALYFSRNVIPYVRDYPQNEWLSRTTFFKHIGIYCFADKIIDIIASMKTGKLEEAEKLEQLRWLENGERIYCHEDESHFVGIDTTEDLSLARKYISQMLSR